MCHSKKSQRFHLTFPWYDKKCSPNSSNKNWRIKHEAKKVQKRTAILLSRHLPKAQAIEGLTIPIVVVFNPESKLCDLDNCLASIKAYLDGIADHIAVNDKCFRPITIDFGDYEKPGSIDIYLNYIPMEE